MNTKEMRFSITVIAHSLACAHNEPSYIRPQYFAFLCQSLGTDAYRDLKSEIQSEIAAAVMKQCGARSDDGRMVEGDEELFWEAFGRERVDSKADFSRRSAAYQAFSTLTEVSGLPNEVVSQALVLRANLSAFTVRMLAVPQMRPAKRLYANPLSSLGSLRALADWKLGHAPQGVDTFRAWVLNAVHHQVRFRYKLGLSLGADFDDVAQDVISRVLAQLCIYQPSGTIKLQTWTFGAINQSVSMSLRSRQPRAVEIPIGSGAEVAAMGGMAESRSDDEADSRNAEMAEYAITQAVGSKRPARREKRMQVLARMIGPMLRTDTATTREQLAAQLKSYFPSITESQVSQIIEQSGLEKDEVCK